MRYPFLCLLISLALLTQCARQSAPKSTVRQDVSKPRRIEILFLGDNGHHKPIERVPQLMAALGNRGINITYTDRLEDLNADNLNQYDGLLIYANWDSIPKPQEKALLDYVASGHGLIPVHCASYCFRNSGEYVDKVVGGQFWRHRMDTIQTRFTQPGSPITAGLPSFRAYDETYLHHHLQADNNVLAVREIKTDQTKDRPDQKEEPYTWTRTYGKGRVFYTAYGHDERTWSQPAFGQLLERGILWAVGDNVKQQHGALNPQPFAYHEARLPNYEKRPGPQMEQEPLSPEESMKHIQVPVGFSLDLFAHEPNVMHPIALAWDERGRLFALITKDYPNERKPELAGQPGGSDVIVICEDTDKDGRADKFTNFAEGLNIPTGMVFANGGLYVSQAPHMLFLQDTNGDDRADVRKVVFTGFGTYDTHAGPSNLHYGFDNWIWGSVGYAGFKGKIGADSVKFSQGFFRFRPGVESPGGLKLEQVTATSNNTWGMAFSETGDVFGSTANNAHGWYMAIPNRFFQGAPDLRESGSRATDTHKDMKPITDRVRQVDVFGGFTAAAGHNFYTARAFPKAYWSQMAFVCEPTGHIVHQNVMQKQGTDYQDAEPTKGTGFNLMAGADEWFAPVFAEVGPDGAVWVVDWYSYIIQHNPTPKGFTNGKGNAYDTPLRDFTHGRIYRVGYTNAPAYTPLTLRKDRPAELVANLKNDNMFWRMTAQRLLVERGNKDVVPQLIALVNDPSVDATGNNPAAIHALWTLKGLGVMDDVTTEQTALANAGLRHPCAAVRKTTVQALPRNAQSPALLLTHNLLADREPLVVLNTLLALSEMPPSASVRAAILARLDKADELNDRWLPDAFAVSLNSHGGQLMKAYLRQATANAPAPSAEPATGAPGNQPAHPNPAGPRPAGGPNPPVPTLQTPTSLNSDQPDLLIAAIRATPESPALRESVRIVVDVTNAGGAPIPAGKVIPLTLRVQGPAGTTEPTRIDFVSITHNTGIKPGETITIDKANNGPWVGDMRVMFERAGEYTLTAALDRDNTIAESNEQNNGATHTLTYRAPPSLSAYVLERASRSYASSAPVDSVVALLRQAQRLDAPRSEAVVKGVSEGWSRNRKAQVREADRPFLASLTRTVSPDNRERLNRLYETWGLAPTEPTDPNVDVIVLKTVREEMRYDKKTFTVTAGKAVELVLENTDAMQHNLVIGKPKSMDLIGAAADRMITAKDGAEKSYVPRIPQVIAFIPLVNPDGTYRLKFTAPAAPGDYPFVCTFPGHWRIMNGIMNVVSSTPAAVSRK